ncbi:MAG: hypothetical protein WA326_13730 [Nitrososphaeraceae archaeon]
MIKSVQFKRVKCVSEYRLVNNMKETKFFSAAFGTVPKYNYASYFAITIQKEKGDSISRLWRI